MVLGGVYWGQKLNQEGIVNINGVLFLFLGNITFFNVLAVVNVSYMN